MTVKEYNNTVDLYADSLYRFAVKTLSDSDTAKDVVQDSFERLWLRYTAIDIEKAKSYLFTTAYRLCIDIFRREKSISAMENYMEPHTRNEYSDIQEVLHIALNTLPAIQRAVVLLRDYEGYSYDEIGEVTGLNPSQVKVYIYRARVALKKFIGKPEIVI